MLSQMKNKTIYREKIYKMLYMYNNHRNISLQLVFNLNLNLSYDSTFPIEVLCLHRWFNNWRYFTGDFSNNEIEKKVYLLMLILKPTVKPTYCNRFALKKFAPSPVFFSALWATAISFNETSNRSYGTLGWSSLRPLSKVFSLFVPNYRHRGSCGSPRVESGSGGRWEVAGTTFVEWNFNWPHVSPSTF